MRKRFILIPLLLVFFIGCVTVEFDNTGVIDPVAMNDAILKGRDYEVIDQIKKREKALFLFGVINIKQPDLEGDLRRAVRQGDMIVNAKFKAQYRLIDVLIGVFTAGIIIPRTVTMEADVINLL